MATDVECEVHEMPREVLTPVRPGWMIRPRLRGAFVFRPGQSPQELNLEGALAGDDVIPGYSLPFAERFGWLTAEE